MIGFGGVPAIADVDLDGRNELVVMSDAWNGIQVCTTRSGSTTYTVRATAGSNGVSSAGTRGTRTGTGRLRLRLRPTASAASASATSAAAAASASASASATATSSASASASSATPSAGSALRRPARDRQAAPSRADAHPAGPLLPGPRQEEALGPRRAGARSAAACRDPPTLRRSGEAGRRPALAAGTGRPAARGARAPLLPVEKAFPDPAHHHEVARAGRESEEHCHVRVKLSHPS